MPLDRQRDDNIAGAGILLLLSHPPFSGGLDFNLSGWDCRSLCHRSGVDGRPSRETGDLSIDGRDAVLFRPVLH